MTSYEAHFQKYRQFKADATQTQISIALRIEAYFLASFHLIETVCAKKNLHINKHQHVRSVLVKNVMIFAKDSDHIWQNFQEIENRIRTGTSYGSKTNGSSLQKCQQCFEVIEQICLSKLGGLS